MGGGGGGGGGGGTPTSSHQLLAQSSEVVYFKFSVLICNIYIHFLYCFGFNSGIYADGPGAYLFHGVVEQQYIFHVMDHAMCLSDSKQGKCDKHVARGGKRNKVSQLFLALEMKLVSVSIALLLMFM